jgi:lipopolysaccharide transport system ATP-binding protein
VNASASSAVVAQGLGKTYRVYARPWDRLREALTGRPRHHAYVALDEVSFELSRGEALGLIGENGAGKSTLLRLLAGISAPSRGRLHVQGTLASILELGSAFHPELSGRQNIALNAAMLGLDADELRARTPAIIDFAELGRFIDEPVKCYSTGMAMRLGFAIAVQVEPEVLLVDEALAVGDGRFQRKCLERLQAFMASGRTLILCSHALYYVSAFCTRALWLRAGRVAGLGRADDVVRDYERFLLAKDAQTSATHAAGDTWTPAHDGERPGPACITAVRVGAGLGEAGATRPGQPWTLEIEWQHAESGRGCHLAVGIDRVDGVQVFACDTRATSGFPLVGSGRQAARLRLPNLPLLKGDFTVYVFLLDEQALHVYDRRVLPAALRVDGVGYRIGLVDVAHAWEAL